MTQATGLSAHGGRDGARAEVDAVIASFGDSPRTDPYPLFRALRTQAPVMEGDILKHFGKGSQASLDPERRVFTLFRHDDISEVLLDTTRFSSRLLGDGVRDLFGGFMITATDGEEHRRARVQLQPAFAPKLLSHWKTEVIEPLAQNAFVDRLRPLGGCDLVSDLARPYPIRVMYSVLGYSPEHIPFERFADWAKRILYVVAGVPATPEEARAALASAAAAMAEMNEHTLAFIAHRRAEAADGDDIISRLLRAGPEGDRLDDATICGFLRTLLPAAGETTTQSLTNLMLLLLQRPDLLVRVRADLGLLPRAIDEALRFEPVASFLAREAEEDTTIRGISIPKGAGLLLATGSANRDEAVYERPDEFDIDRPPRTSLSFGYGPHLCVGMHLARTAMTAVSAALLTRLPNLRLDPDSPTPQILGVHRRSAASLPVVWDAA